MLQKLVEKFRVINTKLKIINSRIFRIIASFVLISTVSASFLWGYLYVYEDINVINYISWKDSKKTDELNYEFNISWKFQEKNNWEIISSWSLELNNWEIVTKNKWLKQRIKIWKLKVSNTKENIEIKNLDMISDNEKVYYFLEQWFDKIIEQLPETNTTKQAKEAFNANQYVMIDNSKPLIRVLGDLAKNDLIKKLAISLSTSNPSEYNKQNWVDKELKDFLTSDKLLDYIFLDWEYDSFSKKTPLTINPKICNDYAPVIENIIKEVQENNDLWLGMIWDLWKDCSTSISKINIILPMLMKAYKSWDIKNWNFTLSISQWNIADINVVYKNHKINTWYTYLNNPDNSISLKINWDKDKIISSIFKVDYSIDNKYENSRIKWVITNWTWKITLNSNSMWLITNWNILFKDYKLENYNINSNWWNDFYKIKFTANWNLEAWNINWSVTEWDEETWKIKLNYTKDTFLLDWFNDEAIFKVNYKKDNLDLYLMTKHPYTWKKDLETAFNYKDWIIDWYLKEKHSDINIKWNIYNIHDYNIEIKENNSNSKLSLKWEKTSLKSAKHNFIYNENWEDIFSGRLNLKATKIKWFNTIKWSLNLNNIKKNEELIIDLGFDYKKWWAKYNLPENFKEIDISIFEVSPVPNYYELNKINKKLLLGWAALAWTTGTIAYISLQWYSADARNSKRLSDLWNIQSAISLKQIEWVPLESFVIMNEKYAWKEVFVWGEKLILWENYFVWTPNYDILNINKKDFSDPDWIEYIIWVSTKWFDKFQILAFMENNWRNELAKINWTYKAWLSDSKWLIYINWKVITNQY